MRFVIVTGMSGAGKSTALKILEDFGYYCVDNLPNELIPQFARLTQEQSVQYDKVALGVDSRSDVSLQSLKQTLSPEFLQQFPCEILFLDAGDEVLMKRYKETRRSHPFMEFEGNLEDCIEVERERTRYFREIADYICDTSRMLTRDLRGALHRIFVEDKAFNNLNITLVSFGFKFGIPKDADLVFDVRFLPNPFYVEELKHLTGNDAPVAQYVMKHEVSQQYFARLKDFLDFQIPQFIAEGRTQLVIAVGCTGGRHRSVTIVNALYEALKDGDCGVSVVHSVISPQ